MPIYTQGFQYQFKSGSVIIYVLMYVDTKKNKLYIFYIYKQKYLMIYKYREDCTKNLRIMPAVTSVHPSR